MFKHVGLSLTVMRELKGISQAELARRAGVGKSQLSKYETGRELPKLDSLQKVLEALEADSLAFFYLEHFLGSIGGGRYELLLGANMGPLAADAERQAFALLTQDIFQLFQSQVASRVASKMKTRPVGAECRGDGHLSARQGNTLERLDPGR